MWACFCNRNLYGPTEWYIKLYNLLGIKYEGDKLSSNININTIRMVSCIHKITKLQIKYSLAMIPMVQKLSILYS